MKTWPFRSAWATVGLTLLVGLAVTDKRVDAAAPGSVCCHSQDVGEQATGSDDLAEEIASLAEALASQHLAVRLEAIRSLGALAVEAKSPAAAQVVQMLLDHRRIEFNDYEDLYVETAMRELGPVVVSEVERQALSSDLSQVSNACEAMRCLGAEFYAQVQPVLAQMLESKENDHHWGALYTLEKMGPAAQDLLPLVKPNLTHSDFQLQIIALRALAGIGPPAMVHEEIVRDLTTNGQNVSVKSHALRALGYIAAGEPKQAEAAAEVIGKNLKEFAFATKSRALEGLIQLQANAAPTAGVIKELLHDQTGLAPQAAVVHGYITGEWDTTIKLLVSLIKDPVVGMECLDLLRKLGPKAVAAETAIRDMTGNEDETVAWLAVDALAALVNVQDKSALEQLDTDQRQRLDRIAAHLQKFSTEGEIEPHHRAGVLVAQWQGIGWQPKEKAPAPAAEQTPASVPAARE